MKITLNKYLPLAVISLIPFASEAAPTVTFQGEVTEQTCTVDINGTTNAVVLLPTVSIKDFGATLAASQTAGLTPFKVTVSGCTAGSSNTALKTNFLGYNVDTTYGVLGNTLTGANAATGFGIQLLNGGTSGSTAIALNGVTSVTGLVLPAGENTASYEFGAQYFSLGSAGTPGKITSVAEYSISYL
ncbi:fimbrial protein [Enterobacter vonholyi]|uniref:fimbrial protein n=1 Tax=Enterobacter vonholyi TaxID=2797505 RepID=UPI002DB947DB|nr:fimbrial protein [Enterobacter vonholyi]MEB5981527.1 type 1 fimbrial protein [Enterobacter vonholyi]